MDTNEWHKRVDVNNFLPEQQVIESLDDADVQAEHGINDDRRIFRLTEFFVYDKDTKNLVSLDLERFENFSVAGRAIPMIPDDNAGDNDAEGESEEDEQVYAVDMRLSTVSKIEFTYLDISDAYQEYLLEKPADFYHAFHQELFRQFRLTLVILRRVYEHPEERLSYLLSKFRRIASHIERRHTQAIQWGYPVLHPADLQDCSTAIARNVSFYMRHIAHSLTDETNDVRRIELTAIHERLQQSSAIASILKGALATIRRRDNEPLAPPGAEITEPTRTHNHAPDAQDIIDLTYDDESDEEMDDEDQDDLTHARGPARRICVTPIVERIARRVFSSPLNLIGERLPEVTWRPLRAGGIPFSPDGRLKVGDCVMVPAGIDNGDLQQHWAFNNDRTTSQNPRANDCWFGYVAEISEDHKRVHLRWFDHSAKSDLLKELERPMELFLTHRCTWISCAHVKQLVDVKFLAKSEEPLHEESQYYCRFIRNHASGAFTRITPTDHQADKQLPNCVLCSAPTPGYYCFHGQDKKIQIGDIYLHKGDFFVMSPPRESPWPRDRAENLASVVQLRSVFRTEENGRQILKALHIRGFERASVLEKQGLKIPAPANGRPARDERRLCLMDAEEWEMSINLVDIARYRIRKCFVQHPDVFNSTEAMNTWLVSPIHFLADLRAIPSGIPRGDTPRTHVRSVEVLSLDHFKRFPLCSRCKDETAQPRITKMRMLDMFSGAGGLSQGLVQAGICIPKYAIDHDESACATYSANFPGVKTIHGDVNVILSKTLIAAREQDDRMDISDPPARSLLLPEQHEIDFVCGGPPCQSFSGANRFKRDNDPRIAMVATVMSAVEHYRPKYFLIENVPNALNHKIVGPTPREGSTDSSESLDAPIPTIEQGILRFLMRASLDLGYSFRVGVLQAAHFGAPQRRRRAYILGAHPDLTLPEFPLATHDVKSPETGMKLPTGGILDSYEERAGFPLQPSVTVWDAISDLKPFEWINPHRIVSSTQTARNETRRRRYDMGIPTFDAVREERCEVGLGEGDTAIGYREEMPATVYQLEARQNMEVVTGHYTSSFRSEVFVERITTVPLSADADHRVLPLALRRGDFLSNVFGSGGSSDYYAGAFGRYDRKKQFVTILTSLRPAKKNGFCIHPEQKRMLSMRELARAQGFPDEFVFHGTVDDVNRQIGNAVVVQVSHSIGKEIKRAMIKDRII